MEKSALQKVKDRIREHGQSYKIDELCLDEIPIGQFTPDISKLIEKCVNIDYLTLVNCQLTNLSNLPRLPKLETLELDYNKLANECLESLEKYAMLKNLLITNNQLSSVEALNSLKGCRQLEKINILQNPIAKAENYRQLIFEALPQLESIDGYNKDGEEVEIFNSQSEADSQASGSQSGIDESDEEEKERESPSKMRKK